MKKISKFKASDSRAFILTAITIGGSLEWYEIGLFIAWPLLVESSEAGFDISLAESINAGAMLILVALALANGGARALGGWFFGKKGDEKGRQVAFPLTLLASTLPSWSLAILSFFLTYEHWLTYSTVIFAIVKFFQGMPAGVELPGAICYLSETANGHKKHPSWLSRRYMCSYALLGPQIGLALSALLCLALKAFLSPRFLIEHAWRYVFIVSGLIGIGGYMMRKKIHETAEYLELRVHHGVTHKPLKILFTKYPSRVFLAAVLSIFEVVTFAVLSIVPYYYLRDPFYLSSYTIIYLTLGYSGLSSLLLPFIGFLSTRIPSFPWLRLSVWGVIITTPALYFALLYGAFGASLIFVGILVFFLSIQGAILPSILAEIFPVRVRYTGIAFSFNICDGVLWSATTGICVLFLALNKPAFLILLPISAIIFLIATRMGRKEEQIYRLLK